MLEQARRLGLVGPGPLLPHLDHALGFGTAADALDDLVAGHLVAGHLVAGDLVAGDVSVGGAVLAGLDLGSGAGLPGLPLALARPDSRWMLVDAGERRVEFLSAAVRELGLQDRVEVVGGRAEELGRDPRLRGRFVLVVARGFGPPAVTAECGAPFLAVGGRMVVSEPPGGRPDRWPAEGLALLGLEPAVTAEAGGAAYQVLRQRSPCPERFPRRTGIPAKRPLFATP